MFIFDHGTKAPALFWTSILGRRCGPVMEYLQSQAKRHFQLVMVHVALFESENARDMLCALA